PCAARAGEGAVMTRILGIRRTGVLVVVAFLVALVQPPVVAANALTVAQAISSQGGSSETVRGYVVGQPVGTNDVITSGFPNDYALAIADTLGETDTGDMLYVQVTSAHRGDWGLASNPDLVGEQIDVTGSLT